MGEYDFERLTRYRKIDILKKALEDANEHQRFKAVEALEEIALGSTEDTAAYDILVDASSRNPYDDVRQHAQIVLKNINGYIKEHAGKLDADKNTTEINTRIQQKQKLSGPYESNSRRIIVVCEFDDDSNNLRVHGDTLDVRHQLDEVQGAQRDGNSPVWKFPINRSSIDGLKKIGVMLHPAVQSIYTSSRDTWALKTRNKKWIKIVGASDTIVENLKQVQGCEWDNLEKVWKVPFHAESIKQLMKIDGLYVSPFILD
jgi:hypothetical protein